MKTHIVCFGDSNTYGLCTDPNDRADPVSGRFNEEERWPCLLQKELGETYLVIEEGMSGRTIAYDDPTHGGRRGLDYIVPCLESHAPVSLLVIMLGTNDMKERWSANATTISQCMERMICKAKAVDCWAENGKILLICPPRVPKAMEETFAFDIMGPGCPEKSEQLPPLYRAVAERAGCLFYDAADCPTNHVDFLHLQRKGHVEMARAVKRIIDVNGI